MKPQVEYLYNSGGEWIAFRVGNFVFDKSGEWIGWLPWNDGDVVDRNGQYVASIFPGNRLYRKANAPYRPYPGDPGYPGFPGYPGYPGYAGYSPLPTGVQDVNIEHRN